MTRRVESDVTAPPMRLVLLLLFNWLGRPHVVMLPHMNLFFLPAFGTVPLPLRAILDAMSVKKKNK